MKKLISLFLCLCLAAGLAPAAAESADAARTVGAKWIAACTEPSPGWARSVPRTTLRPV